jgi:capsular exopolysaccharide synthesis family protein
MMSEDNRLMPLSPSATESLNRPLRDLTQPSPLAGGATGQTIELRHLRDYLQVVLKRKWLILSLVVVVTSLVAIQMYRQPSIYQAETQVQIEQKNKSVLQTRELVIQAPRDPMFWNTQLKLIENPTLARQVILALDLHNNPEFLGGQARSSLLSSIRRVFSRDQAAPAAAKAGGVPVVTEEPSVFSESLTPEQSARLEPYEDALRANLTVEPVERTSLVAIRFRHTSPEISARVANTLAAVFIANDIQRETQGSSRAEDTLAKQIADLQLQIQQDEERRINYMLKNDIPLGDKKGQDLSADRLGTYSTQLQAAEAARKELEADYNAARTTKDIWSIPQVQSDKTVQRLREKISDLEESRAALMVKYTAEWPEVKKIDEQIKRLKQDLDNVPREILTSMRVRLEAAQKREADLRSSYFSERGQANQRSISETGLSDLNSRLETNKQLYNTYIQRQRELQVTSSDKGQNVTQVLVARQPHEPIGPPRARNIFIALLLSLGAGIGLAFLLDYLDDTLKSIEDVDRYIHLPTLALIPAPRPERAFLRGRHNLPLPVPGDGSTALTLIEDVRSPIAESYRHLRTSLLLSSAGQPPRTVLVTSSQPSEGKTTTAVNIAMMLAQTGAEVLVLDCDLRRPRIHTHFGLANAKGVSNYLSGEMNVSELVQTYDKLPNLKVITSGPVPPNAAELLGSEEMRKLLYVLSEKFTHIIIDSPPAISFTDASILSTLVDGVMLVVHGGRSSRAVVRRAKQQLMDVGAHVFGIVLNNVKLESNDYYYYSGHYSAYYSTDEEGASAPEGVEAAGAQGRGSS